MCTFFAVSGNAVAHVSENGYVLLLPTEMYVNSGLLAVASTFLLLLFAPRNCVHYRSELMQLKIIPGYRFVFYGIQIMSVIVLCVLLYAGFFGNPDPLNNALPLFFWTVFWVGMVLAQGVFGNVWFMLNPWANIHRLFHRRDRSFYRLPASVDVWPAVVLFLCFFVFYLADLAPDNPTRLAMLICAYTTLTMVGMFIFGRKAWLSQCEFFSVLMRLFSLIAPLGRYRDALFLGYPGWKIIEYKKTSIGLAVFSLLVLGSGSFDGINETFWWLAFNGINPLAYPGRSSTVIPSIAGLLLYNVSLILIFAACVKSGQLLVRRWGDKTSAESISFKTQFSCLAMGLLPIAFAYHFAHFLSVFLINSQYMAALLIHSWQDVQAYLDPISLAAAQPRHVTVGFLADHRSVKTLWLSQCVAVVLGHVTSAVLTHSISLSFHGNHRNSVLGQLPLTAFMLAYTYLGLWLLSSPRL